MNVGSITGHDLFTGVLCAGGGLMGRFFPYVGGKSALIPKLLTYIPRHDTYIEVFGGSGELLFSKNRSKTEVYNDINGDLANLFIVVRDNVEEFLEKTQYLIHSREIHERWSNEFKNGIHPDDPIDRASRFYYILSTQFAGKMYGGWAFGKYRRYWDNSDLKKINAIHKRLLGVQVEGVDFRRLIKTWDDPDVFYFLDPPYLDTADYKLGFSKEDHKELADVLSSVSGKWLLTVGDHPYMYELYGEYSIEKAEQRLSLGMADERTENTFTNLIIRNYDLGYKSQSTFLRPGVWGVV